MATPKLGDTEKQVLRAMLGKPSATIAQITSALNDTGESSVVDANASLARNNLVEPVPGQTGALRLTAEGASVAAELESEVVDPGSGGGNSSFN